MVLELVAAALLGGLVLWLVAGPLVSRAGNRPTIDSIELDDVVPPEETRRGQALIAIKELEFDLALGKVADADYEMLRERFVGEALEAMRADEAAPALDAAEAMVARAATVAAGASGAGSACPSCGPRPESDALFCSECGRRLSGEAACASCSATLPEGVRFCPNCGARAAAVV